MSGNPRLIEPGVKYFLCKSLKNCYNVKQKYYEILFNVGLLSLFILLISVFLIYKKKNKISEKERKERVEISKSYLLEKIRKISLEKRKEKEELITNIPKFESSFVQLHKNYYTI